MFGNVLNFDPSRGFGFAVMQDEREVFFHVADFDEHPAGIEYGSLLAFGIVEQARGPRAVRIELIPCELPEETADS